MGNPLIEWIGITDSFGTNIADYAIYVDGMVNTLLKAVILDTLNIILTTAGAVAAWLIGVFTDTNMWIKPMGDIIDRGLDAIFEVFPLWGLLTIAFLVVVARAFMTTEQSKSSSQKGFFSAPDMPTSWGAATRQINMIKNSIISIVIVAVLLANPIAMISKVIEFVNGALSELGGTTAVGEGTSLSSSFTSSMVGSLIMMSNFKDTELENQCRGAWSSAMATGADDPPSCVGDTYNAGIIAFMLVVSILIIGAYAYFAFKLFSRATWFLFNVLITVVTVPYYVFINLFYVKDDASSKQKFDDIYDRVYDAAIYLIYFIFCVFLALVIPGLLLSTLTKSMPQIVALLVVAALFIFIGKNAQYISPRKFLRRSDNPTGWKDFTSDFRDDEGKFTLSKFRDDEGHFDYDKFSETKLGKEYTTRRADMLKSIMGEEDFKDYEKAKTEKRKEAKEMRGITAEDLATAEEYGIEAKTARKDRLEVEKLTAAGKRIEVLENKVADGKATAEDIKKLKEEREAYEKLDTDIATRKSELDVLRAEAAGYISVNSLQESFKDDPRFTESMIAGFDDVFKMKVGDSMYVSREVLADAMMDSALVRDKQHQDAIKELGQLIDNESLSSTVKVAEDEVPTEDIIDKPVIMVPGENGEEVLSEDFTFLHEHIKRAKTLSVFDDKTAEYVEKMSKSLETSAGSTDRMNDVLGLLTTTIAGLPAAYGITNEKMTKDILASFTKEMNAAKGSVAQGDAVNNAAIMAATQRVLADVSVAARETIKEDAAKALKERQEEVEKLWAEKSEEQTERQRSSETPRPTPTSADTPESTRAMERKAASGQPLADSVDTPLNDEQKAALDPENGGKLATKITNINDRNTTTYNSGKPSSVEAVEIQTDPQTTASGVVETISDDELSTVKVVARFTDRNAE